MRQFQLNHPRGTTGVQVLRAIEGQMWNVMIDADSRDGLRHAVATGGAIDDLDDAAADFDVAGVLSGQKIVITKGTGRGQIRTIDTVATTKVTVTANWAVAPDSTSEYIAGATIGIDMLTSGNNYAWDFYNIFLDHESVGIAIWGGANTCFYSPRISYC